MARVVLFGTGKLADLMHYYLTHDSPHQVVGFTVDADTQSKHHHNNLPLVPFEEAHQQFPPDDFQMFIAVGYRQLNTIRAARYEAAKSRGYQLITYISSKATRWDDLVIGDNCCVFENQVIQPTVRIGNNVVLWSGNHFGHDVELGDHCWISSHVVISGGVKIGPYTFVGVNATFRDGVHVGRECIIGAGALLLNDAQDREVYIAAQTERYRLNSTQFERMMEISR